jgi:8-oxo-dGTP pyrophosphatase MutT (NUDIX family)
MPRAALSLEHVRAAMALPGFDGRAAQRPLEPRSRGAPPGDAPLRPSRPGAALLYLFPSAGALRFPLTLRQDDLREHRAQVALPGGRPEAGETPWDAAIRAANEEIALHAQDAERLGVLAPVYIPVTHTDLVVHVAAGPEPAGLMPDPREVAGLVLVRVDDLLEPALRRPVRRTIGGVDVDVPALHLEGLEVWGATAMALSELAERLRVSGLRGGRDVLPG